VTPFGEILREAVQASPNAIGGAFAASDGEMVDCFSTVDKYEWAVLTAHYGIVMAHVRDAFNTLHFGGPEYFFCRHATLEIVVHTVDGGYYALLALKPPADLSSVLERMRTACAALKKEML
jgi:hypothetical protein